MSEDIAFPYYSVYFKADIYEIDLLPNLIFPYYSVYFKATHRKPIMRFWMLNFHTIQSILKRSLDTGDDEDIAHFHTIQSILKQYLNFLCTRVTKLFPYYSVYFKALLDGLEEL